MQPSEDGEDVYDYDEIAATFRVRYMTAMEAYLRLVGYPIVSQSDPVVAMPLCLPGQEFLVFEEGHEGDEGRILGQTNKLRGFFDLCEADEDARKYRYDEIEKYYSWSDNKGGLENPKGCKFWKKRQNPKTVYLLCCCCSVNVCNFSMLRICWCDFTLYRQETLSYMR